MQETGIHNTLLRQEQEEHLEQLTKLLASIRTKINSRTTEMDSAPVVQGIEFPTPQNSACHHLSPLGPNNPVTPSTNSQWP